MKDDMRPIHEFNKKSSGVFIVCEGNFMYGNASLSYYDIKNKNVDNTVFIKANGIPLGDVAQSLSIIDTTAYIIVNNSGKIYGIDVNTFKYKGQITGLVSPRYMAVINPTKAYVSDMYSKSIHIVNPKSYTVTGSIDIATETEKYYRHSSEEMILCDDYIFTNSWSYNNKILVIDTKTDKLVDTITVLKQPRKIVLDKNKKLWVLCDGGFIGSTYSGDKGIVKVDTKSREIEEIFTFSTEKKLIDMKINATKDTIYFINDHIYRFGVNDKQMPSQEYINSNGRNLYAIGLDFYSSDIYLSDAVDYMQSGVVYRYNNKKEVLDKFDVGIIPNSFIFK
jgi:YVTN family beta-propeller protein